MGDCFICHNPVQEPSLHFGEGSAEFVVDSQCLQRFRTLVNVALQSVSRRDLPLTELDGIVERIGNEFVLVERGFKNLYFPILAFAALQNEAVELARVYSWLDKNEVKVANPAVYIHRAKEAGWIAVFENEGKRKAKITAKGIEELRARVEEIKGTNTSA